MKYILMLTVTAALIATAQVTPQATITAPTLSFSPAQGPVLEREWDIDIDYATTDFDAVFAFYDQELQSQGWQQVSYELDGDEHEATYRKDNLELELEVDLDDGKVEVEIEIEERTVTSTSYSLTSLPGFELRFVPDIRILELEWDVDTDYNTTDFQSVFAHYDSLIQSQGWQRVEFEEESDEIEATYRQGTAELELEVELDDGKVEVELEVDAY